MKAGTSVNPVGAPRGLVKETCGGSQGPTHSQSPQQDEAYGESPTQTLCPHCSKAITTTDAVHECPHCRNLVYRRSRVACPFPGRDGVLTLRCGSCAVVLTRRYFICFSALFAVILLCHLFRGGLFDSTLQYLTKGESTSLSWQEFVSLCGHRSQLGNPLQAAANFRESFALRTVQWEGLVKQVKEGFFAASPAFLFLAMNPTLSTAAARKEEAPLLPESEETDNEDPHSLLSELEALRKEEEGMKGDGADLALAFDRTLAAEVVKLSPGDKVRFEATLHELGRRGALDFSGVTSEEGSRDSRSLIGIASSQFAYGGYRGRWCRHADGFWGPLWRPPPAFTDTRPGNRCDSLANDWRRGRGAGREGVARGR
ncbi:hypothetical protein cyc_03806 [Cyclospora cayetanensis]|uniref:Uncharacterized protein n=1 Tax=Cyclospora cayetanensis TaxID=88456 RepID=A0A1D3CW65_9EIME|nr:hypothetical protein cyc_03806 [Cyclospora cayetanensis]